MRRQRIPTGAWLLVGFSVVVAAVRFAVSVRIVVPWVAPDEMLYALIGESLWTTGRLDVLGATTPYYSLVTPGLVGAPLAIGRTAGIEAAQAIQIVVMTSVAIPVYLWTRRTASEGWAVAAGALALAAPAMTYGGLLMTEAAYYPAVTWALFALTLALERPTAARQGAFLLATTIAAAVRLQALVLLAVLALAVALHALQRRSLAPVRRLVPLAAGVVVVGAGVAVVSVVSPDVIAPASLLGAYSGAVDGAVETGLVSSVAWHVAALAVMVLVVPLAAAVLLLLDTLRGRVSSRSAQATAAAVTAYVTLLVVQVGAFAAVHLDHVSQRYLVSAVPALLVALATWSVASPQRGRHGAVAGIAVVLVGVVAAVPLAQLAPRLAQQDTLPTSALVHLGAHATTARVLLVLLVVAGTAAAAFLPTRLRWLVPAVLLVAFGLQSFDAARTAVHLARAEQLNAVGGADASWIDAASLGDVTLVLTGDRPPEADARTVFWNRSVTDVVRLPEVTGLVPPRPPAVAVDPRSGLLVDADGRPFRRRLVAASTTYAFDGEIVAARALGSAGSPPMAVWRVNGPVRVAWATSGLLPNGDFSGVLRVVVPGCAPGRLEVTVIGKSGDPIRTTVDGLPVSTVEIAPGASATDRSSLDGTDGTAPCNFTLTTDGYAGTTRVAYVPGDAPSS